jgi:hypothetical protein
MTASASRLALRCGPVGEVNMFRRFVSGSAIASIVIALAVVILVLTHGLAALAEQRFCPVTVLWCFVPAVWGLWAMFAPAAWVPHRLPVWGAVLGLIAGLLVLFVLNLPLHVLGVATSVTLRGVGVVVIVVLYYLLWMLVRVAYRSLGAPTSVA